MAELQFPEDLKYMQSDEWVRVEGDTATFGISDYAQEQLNDVVYVELPEPSEELNAGEPFGTVESVKAASDLYAPISGVVTEVNSKLEDEPELVNQDPFGEGWMVKIRITDQTALEDLMDAAAYKKYCAERDA